MDQTTNLDGRVPEALIDDALIALTWRGFEFEDDEDPDPAILALLVALASRPCDQCRSVEGLCRSGQDLADHYLTYRQEEWERSLPRWTCRCGLTLVVLAEGRREAFYTVTDDALMGEEVGHIYRNAKGLVRHTARCPSCRRDIAVTRAEQDNPQQPLF